MVNDSLKHHKPVLIFDRGDGAFVREQTKTGAVLADEQFYFVPHGQCDSEKGRASSIAKAKRYVKSIYDGSIADGLEGAAKQTALMKTKMVNASGGADSFGDDVFKYTTPADFEKPVRHHPTPFNALLFSALLCVSFDARFMLTGSL